MIILFVCLKLCDLQKYGLFFWLIILIYFLIPV